MRIILHHKSRDDHGEVSNIQILNAKELKATKRSRALLASPFAIAGAFAIQMGCNAGPSSIASATGSAGFELTLSPNIIINTLHYEIIGPDPIDLVGEIDIVGSIDISASETVSFQVGELPAGPRYLILASAVATDGTTFCLGDARFDVGAGLETTVFLQIRCREAPRNGTVIVNGSLNVCPQVDAVSALPSQVAVGGTIHLTSAAHDADGLPLPFSYLWASPSGVFDDAFSPSPTFTCTEGGLFSVTFTVTDGDCVDTRSVSIACTGVCTPPPPGIVSWWPGEGSLHDIAGDLDLQPMGDVRFTRGEVEDGILLQNGAFGEVANSGAFAFSSDFTIEAWVRPARLPTAEENPAPIVSMYDFAIDDGNFQRLMYDFSITSNGTLQSSIRTCGIREVLTFQTRANLIVPNRMTHVAFVHKRFVPRTFLYVNGRLELVGFNEGCTNTANPVPFRVGMRRDASGPAFFPGVIDEPTIYARMLSAEEIGSIFASRSAGKCR